MVVLRQLLIRGLGQLRNGNDNGGHFYLQFVSTQIGYWEYFEDIANRPLQGVKWTWRSGWHWHFRQ